MNVAAKPVLDFDRVTTTLRALSRAPLDTATRIIERLRGGAAAVRAEAESLRSEFGRAARVEEDLT